jgi:hypothetical protein
LHRCSVTGITISSKVVSRTSKRLNGRVHSPRSHARTPHHALQTVPNAPSSHCRTMCRHDRTMFSA